MNFYDKNWLDKARVLEALTHEGYYYERYPYYYSEYGLTWFTRTAFEKLVADTAPELALVSHRPAELDAHQDIFVYRKR